MHVVRTLLGFVRPHLWALPALVVLGLLASLAEGIGIGMMIPLFDVLLRGEQEVASGWFVGTIRQYGAGLSEEARLTLLAGTILGLIAAKTVVRCAYGALSVWFCNRVVCTLRCSVFRQLLGVDYAFFARSPQGRLFNTLHNQTWRAGQLLTAVSSMIINATAVAVLAVVLLLISWQLTLVTAAGALLATLLVRLVARCAHGFGRQTVEAEAALSKRALEMLSGMRVIRLFGREAREQERFDRAAVRARGALVRNEVAIAWIVPLMEFLYAPLFVGVLLLAWYAGLALPTLLAFLVLLYRLQGPVRQLDQLRVAFASLTPAAAEVADLLDAQNKPRIRSGPVPFHGLKGAIAFKEVGFRYGDNPGGPLALAGVSFEVRKGEVTALVGGSGAGKSTLISLLCRLYDSTEGEILVDRVPLREIDLASWRRRLAFAGQDVELMGDTVFESIAYGRPDADREAVIAAARQADAHGFIMSLPQGYDTPIGERGLRLSAGQRQRIGLARAFLHQPDILILDEATNALDGLSESVVQKTLERLAGRLTMIVIAHRLSTIRHADCVVVLSEGRVVEQGHPHELLKAGGMFARLWRLQTVSFDGVERRVAVARRREVPS